MLSYFIFARIVNERQGVLMDGIFNIDAYDKDAREHERITAVAVQAYSKFLFLDMDVDD